MPGDSSFIAGTNDWLIKLNKALCDLGRYEFEDSLFDLVNGIVGVDHCTVFIRKYDGTTVHLFTKSKLDKKTCQSLAKAYIEDFYGRDPNLLPLAQKDGQAARITLLPHRLPTAYDDAYQARFFTNTGLIDKVSSLLQASSYNIYCSFYRLKGSGMFRETELDELSRILPVLTNLVFKHARLAGLKESENQPETIVTQVPLTRSSDAFANLLDDKNAIFAKLTDRERQVCRRILQGYTSEAISLDLKVAISTIHTYRKRAYAKLGISSQNELFSLYLEFVPIYEDRQKNI